MPSAKNESRTSAQSAEGVQASIDRNARRARGNLPGVRISHGFSSDNLAETEPAILSDLIISRSLQASQNEA